MSTANRPTDREAEVHALSSFPLASTLINFQLTYSKAAKAELSRDYDVAFRLYVKSAEFYLYLSRTGNDNVPVQAAKWKASAAKALERAEKIKAFMDKRKTLANRDATFTENMSEVPTTLTPVGIDHFSAHPDGPPKLSPEQVKVSPLWRRVPSIRTIDARREILPQEILQHVVTDCSVCASISVCLEHSRRFGSNVSEKGSQAFHNLILGTESLLAMHCIVGLNED
ncbi:hypothetical protein C0995_002896 [Termitomyces sp. Mi166|nr:hypothetical protein C0995_002896 [Termitomyces sp. Mi166\